MLLIKPFSELNKNDVGVAGGKGASLGEMTNSGILVPPGFVLLSSAFERFIEETYLSAEIDTILHSVNKEEMSSVEHASERIQQMILGAKMPQDIEKEIEKNFEELDSKFVAVRSSATAEDSASAAWAGQLDSYLNTTEDTLLENVQKCWASLFTPRAIFYRFEKDLHRTKISVAVVVQKMVESEFSGIAFSVHPVTEDRNQLILEAGFGLGEAIVSGQITPDSYVVEKEPRRIIDVNVNTQIKSLHRAVNGGNEWNDIAEPKASSQVLTEKQILELSELIIKIENHYGFPCDIEWAFEKGKFYITQSRPITTLKTESSSKKILTKYMSREHSIFYAHVWNEANKDLFDQYIKGTNVKNLVFKLNKLSVLEVYFDLKELDLIFSRISGGVTKNPKILDKVIEDFYMYFNKLLPYISNKKKIKTVKELKEYYENWSKWWAPMAYVFVIPDREEMSQNLRKKALKVREETQEYSDEGDRVIFDFIKKYYPQHTDIAALLTPSEFYNIEKLSHKEIKSIKERVDGCALVTIESKSSFGFIREMEKKINESSLILKQQEVYSMSTIKGEVASRGIAKGKVKLILKKSDLSSLKNGEVMVTYNTSPDYVPAMKKSVAIVTDEGGVVCHAAIVSRELGLPCVVGTKTATQVLKDGDLVEVDADNGVVRILGKM